MSDNAWVDEALARGATLLPIGIERLVEHFCGCGDPEKAWSWVRDYLSSLREDRLVRDDVSGAEWIAYYLLNDCELTQHGSSVGSSWLTDSGKEALKFLEKEGAEWVHCGKEFVSSIGVSYGGNS